jgi:hypothetical protein
MEEPKIGDLVVITKSEVNWAEEMDKFADKVFEIIAFKESSYRGNIMQVAILKDPNNILTETELLYWDWIYKHKHFKIVYSKGSKRTIKVKLNFATKSL